MLILCAADGGFAVCCVVRPTFWYWVRTLRFRKNSDDQKNTSKTSQTANTQTNQTPPSRATNKQTAGRANQNRTNNSHKTKTTTEHRVHLGD